MVSDIGVADGDYTKALSSPEVRSDVTDRRNPKYAGGAAGPSNINICLATYSKSLHGNFRLFRKRHIDTDLTLTLCIIYRERFRFQNHSYYRIPSRTQFHYVQWVKYLFLIQCSNIVFLKELLANSQSTQHKTAKTVITSTVHVHQSENGSILLNL